eukprot:CAMPEP_0196724356 /NCGR_PEP_ID=MMETSP1091-20130531/6240_1 /TAXON_ID=302021 /ORGANISM="Rhodomonas sp., Strain CCMP768" /LENGTH=139 /DNA_ID=CAMNT_0042066465 /DNA_START=77 /DNA_END=496 /DNA_ORIENTATION=-
MPGETKTTPVSLAAPEGNVDVLKELRKMNMWARPKSRSPSPDRSSSSSRSVSPACEEPEREAPCPAKSNMRSHYSHGQAHTTVIVKLPGASPYVQLQRGRDTHSALLPVKATHASSRNAWSDLLQEVASKLKKEQAAEN